jgi:hypothetical protein
MVHSSTVSITVTMEPQPPPPTQGQLSVSVSPSTVSPTGTITITVTGVTPSEAPKVLIQTEPVAQHGTVQVFMPPAGSDGTSSDTLALTGGISAGTQLVTAEDPSTGATATTTFTITSTGGGGGGGKVSITFVTPVVIGGGIGTLYWSADGLTPGGQVQVKVLTNNASEVIVLSPNTTASSSGNASGSFTVGSNITLGTNTLTVVDLSTGQSASANFFVT